MLWQEYCTGRSDNKRRRRSKKRRLLRKYVSFPLCRCLIKGGYLLRRTSLEAVKGILKLPTPSSLTSKYAPMFWNQHSLLDPHTKVHEKPLLCGVGVLAVVVALQASFRFTCASGSLIASVACASSSTTVSASRTRPSGASPRGGNEKGDDCAPVTISGADARSLDAIPQAEKESKNEETSSSSRDSASPLGLAIVWCRAEPTMSSAVS